jgi:hypothetical protein
MRHFHICLYGRSLPLSVLIQMRPFCAKLFITEHLDAGRFRRAQRQIDNIFRREGLRRRRLRPYPFPLTLFPLMR